jgi:DsbC/DsbD-like thiol-disulfide interchange protein
VTIVMWRAAAALLTIAMAAPAASGWQAETTRSGGPPGPLVTWSLAAPREVRHDGTFTATVKAKVTPGWKFYGAEQTVSGPRPLGIAVADEAFTIHGKAVADIEPVRVKDTIWSEMVAYHERDTAFRVTLRPVGQGTGPATLRLTVRYQVCSDEICLRPTQATLEAPVVIR